MPQGDQFLLVSAKGDELEVAFVDPDAATAPAERDVDADAAESLDVRALALSGRADQRTANFLLDELQRIRAEVERDVIPLKDAALGAMQEPGFWEDDRRQAVLAEAEYLDRLEAALATADKLGRRLAQRAVTATNGAGDLPRLLSLRLHVLHAAIRGVAENLPADVFLRVHSTTTDGEAGFTWVEDVVRMYERWATQRGMRMRCIDESEHLYAISGLGAGALLLPEAGLHVFEQFEKGRESGRVTRFHAVVDVGAWPQEAVESPRPLVETARAALTGELSATKVVRRYRQEPAPLVRDAVRGYRTGRLDRVLAGDFDLF